MYLKKRHQNDYTLMIKKLLLVLVSFLGFTSLVSGQDEDSLMNAMLTQKIVVENPVYKPVVGFGLGIMNFHGEIHDNTRNPMIGPLGYKLNIATYLGKKHMFKTNFFILLGSLTGNERSPSADTTRNWNFKSDIFCIGLNVHYDFGHLIRFTERNFIHPFISIGIENLQFNSKTDLIKVNSLTKENIKYNYWNDGTIRDGAGNPRNRDYIYETDLRDLNRNGLGNYSQNTFAIPVDIGIDMRVTDRVNFRVGSSWHYTFTDNIDDVSPSGTIRKGDKWNDIFSYNYFSLHFDLFSGDKEITLHKLAAEVDADYAMFDDEDIDGIKDLIDQCPATPFGVKVDSVGCPFDGDKDGVPDYMDKELATPAGALVDDNGVEIKAEDFGAKLSIEGINRKDVEGFLLMRKAQSRMKGKSSIPLPAKFKSVDIDADGYISFDELVKSINDFFDSSSSLSSKDIYELQDFFFEQ
jgi:hypothetical protein